MYPANFDSGAMAAQQTSRSRRPFHGLSCLRACDFRGRDLVLEELVKGLHELLRRARLDDASLWQAVAEQLAEAPGLPDQYTSGLLGD